MTSDVKLPPLPAASWQLGHDDATGTEIAPPTLLWNAQKMQTYACDYARACVEANTVALRAELDEQCRLHAIGMERELALIAERDRLRAEVERLREAVMQQEGVASAQAVGCAVAEARAERLAEALRVAEAALADIGDADREPGDDVAWCERRAAQMLPTVRAALNPTAAQEGTS